MVIILYFINKIYFILLILNFLNFCKLKFLIEYYMIYFVNEKKYNFFFTKCNILYIEILKMTKININRSTRSSREREPELVITNKDNSVQYVNISNIYRYFNADMVEKKS